MKQNSRSGLQESRLGLNLQELRRLNLGWLKRRVNRRLQLLGLRLNKLDLMMDRHGLLLLRLLLELDLLLRGANFSALIGF